MVGAACGGATTAAAGRRPGRRSTTPAGGRCVVRLHGKGGSGAPTTTAGDVTVISPTGNSDGWGAKQWLYFPAAEYDAARGDRADAVAGCGPIIVDGFSNGASFAAAMYCHGETFDGRLVRVVIDDPVTDHAVDDCTPAPGVDRHAVRDGRPRAAGAGGDEVRRARLDVRGGRDARHRGVGRALGVPRQQSPHTDHQPYADPPELNDWA